MNDYQHPDITAIERYGYPQKPYDGGSDFTTEEILDYCKATNAYEFLEYLNVCDERRTLGSIMREFAEDYADEIFKYLNNVRMAEKISEYAERSDFNDY